MTTTGTTSTTTISTAKGSRSKAYLSLSRGQGTEARKEVISIPLSLLYPSPSLPLSLSPTPSFLLQPHTTKESTTVDIYKLHFARRRLKDKIHLRSHRFARQLLANYPVASVEHFCAGWALISLNPLHQISTDDDDNDNPAHVLLLCHRCDDFLHPSLMLQTPNSEFILVSPFRFQRQTKTPRKC